MKKTAHGVPLIMQLETSESAAASLAMVCGYYQKWLPQEHVRALCGIARDEPTPERVAEAARALGFDAQLYDLTLDELGSDGRVAFPCLAWLGGRHVVVIRGLSRFHVLLNDPDRGAYAIRKSVFETYFSGEVLALVPGPDFEPEGKRPAVWGFVAEGLKGSWMPLGAVALATAILSVFGILEPALSQVFVDWLLSGREPAWSWAFFAWAIGFCVAQVIVSVVNALYKLQVEGKSAVYSNATFFWKLLHLPMSFYDQRSVGDINLRTGYSVDIARDTVGKLAPLIIDLLMLAVYFVVMIFYSVWLALIGLGAVLVNFLMAAWIARMRVNVIQVRMRDEANLAHATISDIAMIETIKSSGSELRVFQWWAGLQARLNRQRSRYARLDVLLELIPQAVTMLANVSIMILGLQLIFEGALSVGMVLAFEGYFANFMTPAQELADALETVIHMRTAMERSDDVSRAENDPLAVLDDPFMTLPAKGAKQPLKKLKGSVRLDHVTFGYEALEPPAVCDISFTVKAGHSLALVGASGSGKSTIAGLLSGLYEPWKGEVFLDGMPIDRVPKDQRTGSIAVVDQDIVLFGDTFTNNITLWDKSITNYEVVLAARDACVHRDILKKPDGYNHVILENGGDLSGGERQRVEIARALAHDPTVLVMDEATSALDAATEHRVMERVRKRGLTLIVVAHRLSTVRDCDEILVLSEGRIAERGTHAELMALEGRYAHLVANE